MSTPEITASASRPSNNTLLYDMLTQGLLSPNVTYSDAHYLNITLPAEDAYGGGSFRISNYPDYTLRATKKVLAARHAAKIIAMETGEPLVPTQLTSDHHQAFLAAGISCLDVEVTENSGQQQSWALFHLKDIRPNDPLAGLAMQAAADIGIALSPDETVVYSTGHPLYIADAFTEPHLQAVYKHLASQQLENGL